MRTMVTKSERQQCERIIQYHKQNAIGGSLRTKFGPTVNLEELTKMARTLAKVFKVSMTKSLASATAVNMLKDVESRINVREFVEKIPNGRSTLPVFLARSAFEFAGWQMVGYFADQRRQ